jgi:hypothetical protein
MEAKFHQAKIPHAQREMFFFEDESRHELTFAAEDEVS